MRITILIFSIFWCFLAIGQTWYSRFYDYNGRQEAARAMTRSGDSIFMRNTFVCDTTLCTQLGIFSESENEFLEVKDFDGVQTGSKNLILTNESIFISSEERNKGQYITVNQFNQHTLDLISKKDFKIDSSQYLSYVIRPAIQFGDKLIIGSNVLDSTIYVNYHGWYNYQEKALLFVLDDELNTDTFLVIPPSSGAFLKISDMAIGPDSILYISFYEEYLKQGNQQLYLADRKVIFGYNRNFEKVFQWIGPDYLNVESLTHLTIDEDTTIYFNYEHNYNTYLAALRPDGTLIWECQLDSNPGAYLYYIHQIVKTQQGDIIGTGTISSAVDSLGESGFIFKVNRYGHLLWKRAFRINAGEDLILPPQFPIRSTFEDIIELENGDLLATGWVIRYLANAPPGEEHNYDVWIVRTNSDGCLWEDCPFIQSLNTAIDEPSLQEILVYPNPTTDELHFNIPNQENIDRVILYNNLGQIVLTYQNVTHETSLDVSQLPGGIYYGLVKSKNEISKFFKVIISR